MDASKFGAKEVDPDYAWFLETGTNEETIIIDDKDHRVDENKYENIINDKDHGEIENNYENIIDDKDHAENENKCDHEDENDDDIDSQYRLFLKGLVENGKSYKLKISRNDETPCFLEYEGPDGYEPQTDTDISFGYNGDNMHSSENMVPMQIDQRLESSVLSENRKSLTTKEVSRKKKINVHKSMTEPRITASSCYKLLLDGCIPHEYGAFDYEGKQVKYEEKDTSSDSDILILENDMDCNEVTTSAEKDPSLKDKLMLILKKPYDNDEYEQLLQYAQQRKPICRLLPLRHRAVSSALGGVTKSVLDDVPGIEGKLKEAQNDRPRALNLLRMLRFWLQYLPNKDSFKPWADEDCLRVQPSSRT